MDRVRLQDIAEMAGVSSATVSRLLNKPEVVSAQTRAEILRAMDLLGFDRPEKLQESSETRIGIVLPELTNPVFAATAHQLSSLLSQAGAIALITSQSPGAASEPALVRALVAARCKGIVVVSGRHADVTSSGEIYRELQERTLPFVTINGPVAGAPSYNTDENIAMELAVAHLYDLGHRKIALIDGSRRFFPAEQKARGFEAALEKRGLNKSDCPIVEAQYSTSGGALAALSAVNMGATGLVFASDMMAVGALDALKLAGYDIPGDISLVGFDGTEFSAHLNPPLTTVKQSLLPICAQAVNTILAMIAGEDVNREASYFAPELVIRSSTGSALATVH